MGFPLLLLGFVLPQKLKAAGFGSQKLDSSWHQKLGKDSVAVGKVEHVPRQA
jgi:hypothetical protein